ELALELAASDPRYYMPYQYANEANPLAHYNGTAVEILDELDDVAAFVAGLSSGAIARVAVRIAGELDEGNVVFIVADDGWKYLSSGLYTLPLEQIENLESTLWW